MTRPRRRRRALAGVAIAVVCAIAGAPAVAARPSQDDDATAPDRLTLVAQSPWVAPEGVFELTVAVADLDEGDTVSVSVRNRTLNRTQFLTTLDGEGVRGEVVAAEATMNGDQATVQIPGDEVATAGVYPVVVDLEDADGELADRLVTHLLRLDPDPSAVPLGVAVIVPVHADPAHITPEEIDTDALDRLGVTVAALADHPDLALTVVPTPETVDALAATDSGAASTLAAAVQGSQILGGPWVRLDPGSWARAGRSTAAHDRAGTAALRTVLGDAGDRSTWVAPDGLSRPSVATAAEGGAARVIVASTDLEPLDTDDFPKTLTRPFQLALDDGEDPATVDALAADAALAAHHGDTDDPVLDAHRTLADLAALAVDDPSDRRVAVLSLDDDATTDADFLGVLLAGLEPPAAITPEAPPAPPPATDTSAPGDTSTTTTTAPPAPIVPTPLVVVEPVESAFDAVTPAGADGGADEDDPLVRVLLDDGPAPSLGSMPAQLGDAEERLASYRSVFGLDDPRAEAVDVVLLTAASADLDDEQRRGMLGRSDDALDADLAAITGPPNQRVTLTDRTGVVQLVFGNATGRPADVTLHVRSDRLELPGDPDGDVPVRLDGATTRFDLHLRARTSGDAPLDLVVTSPDGRITFGESRITVRTTAFSGVGLVLMGTAAGFLVLWWTRTILRERRAKRRAPAHARAH